MARQKGIIPIEGTLGNITFYKTKDGHLIKQKSGISATRMANDPAFERTRENGREFGKSGKAAKLFRTAFRSVALNIADYRMFSRLVQIMAKIVKMDATNQRGQRGILDDETTMMEGFNFNKNATLESTLFVGYALTADKATENVKGEFTKFTPTELIAAPKGTTHFRLVVAATGIDFEKGMYAVGSRYSAYLEYGNTPIPPQTLDFVLSGAKTNPWFLCVGIEFFQEVNNTQYSLNNGAYNAMAVVKVAV